MKFISAAASYKKGAEVFNNENYFINGRIIESDSADETFEAEEVFGSGIYAIADGGRSEADGNEAAYIAVNELKDYDGVKEFGKENADYFNTVNEMMLHQEYLRNGNKYAADTAVLCLRGSRARFYLMGDVAIVRVRSGKAELLSESGERAVRVKNYVADEYGEMRYRTIERDAAPFIGVSEADYAIVPYIKDMGVKCGDVLLLLSRAAYSELGETDLVSIVNDQKLSVEEKTKLLARKIGAKRNSSSVVMVEVKSGTDMKGMIKRMTAAAAMVVLAFAAVFTVATYGDDIVNSVRTIVDDKFMGERDELSDNIDEMNEKSREQSAAEREKERALRAEKKAKKQAELDRAAREAKEKKEKEEREAIEKAIAEKEAEEAARESANRRNNYSAPQNSRPSAPTGSSDAPKKETPSVETQTPGTQAETRKPENKAPQGNVEQSSAEVGQGELPIDFGG